jgi:DNA-binding XRE family transcriptional regulator
MWTTNQPDVIAESVRALRADTRLTQRQLAERADVSLQTIQNLERGEQRTYRDQTIRRVEQALGLRRHALSLIDQGEPLSEALVAPGAVTLRGPVHRDIVDVVGGPDLAERLGESDGLAFTTAGIVHVVDEIIEKVHSLRMAVESIVEADGVGDANRAVIAIKMRELGDEFTQFAEVVGQADE